MSQDSSYDFSEIAKYLHATNISNTHMKNNIKNCVVWWGGGEGSQGFWKQ